MWKNVPKGRIVGRALPKKSQLNGIDCIYFEIETILRQYIYTFPFPIATSGWKWNVISASVYRIRVTSFSGFEASEMMLSCDFSGIGTDITDACESNKIRDQDWFQKIGDYNVNFNTFDFLNKAFCHKLRRLKCTCLATNQMELPIIRFAYNIGVGCWLTETAKIVIFGACKPVKEK